MIKKAKRCESEKWKAAREQVSDDMDEEIQRHLRKIKRDLLGQELGDLRSCVMKLLDTPTTDALKAVFDCCLEMFDKNRQKKITEFLTMITKDTDGRRLFQLALNMSCKRLLGDAVEKLVDDKVKTEAAKSKANSKEAKAGRVPPSKGLFVCCCFFFFGVKVVDRFQKGKWGIRRTREKILFEVLQCRAS